MREHKRRFKQRVVFKVELPDGQVVRGSPVSVDVLQRTRAHARHRIYCFLCYHIASVRLKIIHGDQYISLETRLQGACSAHAQ